MVKQKTEAVMPLEMVARLARAAGEDVMVGGQALAVWIQYYQVALPAGMVAVTVDVDFLTPSAANKHSVAKFARVLGGATFFPSWRALTALVGQAYRDISDDEYFNVDVICRVAGISARRVIARAVRITIYGDPFLLMHPLHVLQSRVINLHKLHEKQNDKGKMQLRLAIDVAREFLRAEAAASASASVATGRSPIQRFVSEIEQLAIEDAGRKIARRHGVHVADAIDPSLIPAGPFWTKRWPGLRGLMSKDYADRFTPPGDEAGPGVLREPPASYRVRRDTVPRTPSPPAASWRTARSGSPARAAALPAQRATAARARARAPTVPG
jgi:hypothetical protein